MAGHAGRADKMPASKPYLSLLVSTCVSYVVMYLLMYAMADRIGRVYFNLSNVYMTGLMAGIMVPIMLLSMPGMFTDAKLTAVAWASSVALLGVSWFLLRTEAGVGETQFLRAMIPHHSAAIQMCQESSLTDPRITALCKGIVRSQEQEIAEMQSLLAEKK